MESVTSYSNHMKTLQRQAVALASAGPALTALLDAEASRLRRMDEASRLVALRSAIIHQLHWAESIEYAASCAHSDTKLTNSLINLGFALGTAIISKDRRALAFFSNVLKPLDSKEPPSGKVMVCIGPRGVPDDVEVVSISGLARESKREEPQVINELERRGCLLFSESAFSLLVDKLADGVQEGRLSLPISTEKLSQIETSSRVTPVAKK